MKSQHSTLTAMSLFGLMAATLGAAPSVSVDNVVQRWPWNNKVDITYTVNDGQDVSASRFCRLVFTVVIDGTTNIVDGVTDVGASASTGTHVVTWTAPDGIRSDTCSISAALYTAENPSGDDYMVIDLDTGAVTFEGLLASQEASNARYNVPLYKTDKMVLRKVRGGVSYPLGYNRNDIIASGNAPRTVVPTHDWYYGVFLVTQAQYQKICGTNPSGCKTAEDGNEVAHRPAENMTWYDLRGAGTRPGTPIQPNAGGAFFQRLAAKTGVTSFDLPTEEMSEIATRTGLNYQFVWGLESTDWQLYSWSKVNHPSGFSVAVGKLLPNNWGLYDVTGNVYEWQLDDCSRADLTQPHDMFVPADDGANSQRRVRCGGDWAANNCSSHFLPTCRAYSYEASNKIVLFGFRVARVMP